MTIRVFISGIGVRGPGLEGWHVSQPVLAGNAPYVPAPAVLPSGNRLPSAERRRAGTAVKLALDVMEDALRTVDYDPALIPVVFSSSGGDNDNVHAICETLATAERAVSPTRFHNSVHNAAAGYWSLAAGSRAPLTSLCCNDASFPAGLLEASVQAVTGGGPVALAVYDHPYPPPLHAVHPIQIIFGAAWILTPTPTANSVAVLDLDLADTGDLPTTLTAPELENLRTGAPSARSLPLLARLAAGTQGSIIIDYLTHTRLELHVAPYIPS